MYYDTLEIHQTARVISRLTIAADLREARRVERTMGHYRQSDRDARTALLNQTFSAYAWPGGYDLLYYVWERGYLTGDCLCADCARTAVLDSHACVSVTSSDTEEPDYDLCCEDCGTVLVTASIDSAIADQHTWSLGDDGTMDTVLVCNECGHQETFSDRDAATSFLWGSDNECPACEEAATA